MFDSIDTMEADKPRTTWRHHRGNVAIVALVSLSVNCLLWIFIWLHQPLYFQDYRGNVNPDAHQYVQLGMNVWSKGVYSRMKEPPYTPDLLRTPVYPIIAGGITVFFGSVWPLYLMQVLVATTTCLIVYVMGAFLVHPTIGLVAGVLCASDPMLATLNLQAMSEALFIFLSTAAIWLASYVITARVNISSVIGYNLVIGCLVGLAILTRPAGLLLPLIICAIELIVFLSRKTPSLVAGPIVVLLVSCGLLAPWVIRNEIVFHIARLTNADTINLLYFAGAGVYQMEFGIEREEAEKRIVDEYQVVPLRMANNPWLADYDVAAMDARQREAALRIFTQYPVSLLKATATGVAKAALSHSTGELAEASEVPPGMHEFGANVLDGWRTLWTNNWFLVAVFVWQVCLTIGTLLFGAIGILASMIDRTWRCWAATFVALIAYYTSTIAVVGIDAYWRHRSMLMPFLYIFAAVGLSKVGMVRGHRLLSFQSGGQLSVAGKPKTPHDRCAGMGLRIGVGESSKFVSNLLPLQR